MRRLLKISDREKVESGELPVFTGDGRKVRVLCWDRIGGGCPIVALILEWSGGESICAFTENGRYKCSVYPDTDLFVEIPDEWIPFSTEYKEDILAGRVKVRTKRGVDVRIISFDGPDDKPVVGVTKDWSREVLYRWTEDGVFVSGKPTDYDLVIIKSE